MLVLKRNVGESIIINDGIEIMVVEASNGYVKLGINAPKNIKVYRKELIGEIREENRESSMHIDELIKRMK